MFINSCTANTERHKTYYKYFREDKNIPRPPTLQWIFLTEGVAILINDMTGGVWLDHKCGCGLTSHSTHSMATGGAWLNQQCGCLIDYTQYRGKLWIFILVQYHLYYIHSRVCINKLNSSKCRIIVTNNIIYLIIYHQNYSGITSMILVYASLVEAPFYLILASQSVDILTVTGIDCTWLYSDLEIHTIPIRPE